MRDAAGQLADGLHLLRLTQLLLGAPQGFRRIALGGDIAADGIDEAVFGRRRP